MNILKSQKNVVPLFFFEYSHFAPIVSVFVCMVVKQLLVKLQGRTNLQGAATHRLLEIAEAHSCLIRQVTGFFSWRFSQKYRKSQGISTRAERKQLCSRAGLDRRSYSTTEHSMWNDHHGRRKAACKYPRYTHSSAKCEIILCESLLFCLFV